MHSSNCDKHFDKWNKFFHACCFLFSSVWVVLSYPVLLAVSAVTSGKARCNCWNPKSDKKRIKEGIAENNLLSMSSLRHQSERRRYRAFQRGHKCTLEEKSNKRRKNRKEQRGREEEEEGWCVLKNLSLALMTAQQWKQQKQTKVSKTSNESFL